MGKYSRLFRCGRILTASCSCTVTAVGATRNGRERNIPFRWNGLPAISAAKELGSVALVPNAGDVSPLSGAGQSSIAGNVGIWHMKARMKRLGIVPLTKAQAIRVKLGGEPGFSYDFPEKPKGMHWRTYYRLRMKSQEAESRSWPPWVYRMLLRSGQNSFRKS